MTLHIAHCAKVDSIYNQSHYCARLAIPFWMDVSYAALLVYAWNVRMGIIWIVWVRNVKNVLPPCSLVYLAITRHIASCANIRLISHQPHTLVLTVPMISSDVSAVHHHRNVSTVTLVSILILSQVNATSAKSQVVKSVTNLTL